MSKYELMGVTSDNQYKETEKQPEFTGKCTIDGVEYKMAGWRRMGNNGEFVSWKFQKSESPVSYEPKVASPNEFKNQVDDLPF